MARTLDDLYNKLDEIAESLSGISDKVDGDNTGDTGNGNEGNKKDDSFLVKALELVDKTSSYVWNSWKNIEDQVYKSGRAMGYTGDGI